MHKILTWLVFGLLVLMVSGCDTANDGNDQDEEDLGSVEENEDRYEDDEGESISDEETAEETENENEEDEPEEEKGILQLISFSEGDTIDASASTTLVGQAPGGWYFEGVFKVQVQDGYGNVLTETQVTATEDWMISDLVRFTTTLEPFETNGATEGTLVFMKDNPSGLPENDESVSIEVELVDSEGVSEEDPSSSSISPTWDVKANSKN